MRAMLFAAVATAVLLVDTGSTRAAEGAWCASIEVGCGVETMNCSFQSLDACRQEVRAGNKGSCFPNSSRASSNNYSPVPRRAARY